MNILEQPIAPGFRNHAGNTELELPLKGHSGCEVRLVRHNGGLVVEKTSQDVNYNPRLAKQIQKQRNLSATNQLPFVRIPRILTETSESGLVRARMEYVYFLNSLDYFGTASIRNIDAVISMIVAYIDSEIEQCELVEVAPACFERKLTEIEKALSNNELVRDYGRHIQQLKSSLPRFGGVPLPVGICHGDLTFSNIMIACDASAIALIDFLDSFVESPVIDIAKVRQDSRFCWSLMMAGRPADPVRFRLTMQYIDRKVDAHYSRQAWYLGSINLIQAINLLRIAPYAKEESVHAFLLKALNSMELQR